MIEKERSMGFRRRVLATLMAVLLCATACAFDARPPTAPASPRDNPSFHYYGKYPAEETDDAVFFLSDSFLFRVAKPIAEHSPELLTLDTRPRDVILANDAEARQSDAYFLRALGVFAVGDGLCVLHQKREPQSIDTIYELTQLARDGGRQRVIAELPGLSEFCWRRGDALFLLRYAHDDENRRITELISLSLLSGDVQVHARIKDSDISSRTKQHAQPFVVAHDSAYLRFMAIDEDQYMQFVTLRVELESGRVSPFSQEIEDATQ